MLNDMILYSPASIRLNPLEDPTDMELPDDGFVLEEPL